LYSLITRAAIAFISARRPANLGVNANRFPNANFGSPSCPGVVGPEINDNSF
jgi:hypothetical protein